MTHFHALTPRQAIKVIEAAGVEDAAKLIRDHAAAGLVRTYAHMQVVIAADGQRREVRDAAVSVALWERIVHDGVDGDVWNGGTVRLAGSDLIGGTPAVHITGFSFNPGHVNRLADQQGRRQPPVPKNPRPAEPALVADPVDVPVAIVEPPKRTAPDPMAIPPGAILCTIKQAGEALGFGRTKVNDLMNSGKLERRMVGGSPRITVASVRSLAR